MIPKEMRIALKEKGVTVPVSNANVLSKYNEVFPENAQSALSVEEIKDATKNTEPLSIVPADNEYTYIGAGETPPHMIKFMGLQNFTRGQLTKVTNPVVLAKLKTHPCFVKGEVNQDALFDNDEKAKKIADKQRDEDQATQIYVERQNRKTG